MNHPVVHQFGATQGEGPMKKILIVDDDAMIRKMVSGLLTKESYQVETAVNGVEGLKRFSEFKPDVIISDVLMPEMDGYEFATRIRQHPDGRHIPLLLLTSLDSVEQKIRGFDVGADDYIVKPFEPREFLARIALLVKRSEIIQKAPSSDQVRGKCLAVYSLRGGSGVSTFATNLAVALSQIWKNPTSLVDMVMTGGHSALYLNLPLKNTWAELTQFPVEEIDQQLVRSALLPHESGVLSLASPRRPENAEFVTEEKVEKVIKLLKESHEYVVLDLAHDLSPITLTALDHADQIMIILQPEIISIRSAVIALNTFTELGYDLEQIHLILNWTFPRQGLSIADIEKSLQKKISLVFPYAVEEILQGIHLGKPPVYTSPNEPIGILFEDLALAFSKKEHRKKKPENPSEAWERAVGRVRKKKSNK